MLYSNMFFLDSRDLIQLHLSPDMQGPSIYIPKVTGFDKEYQKSLKSVRGSVKVNLLIVPTLRGHLHSLSTFSVQCALPHQNPRIFASINCHQGAGRFPACDKSPEFICWPKDPKIHMSHAISYHINSYHIKWYHIIFQSSK